MHNLLRNNWRLLIPLSLMLLIFIFSNTPATTSDAESTLVANLLGLPHLLTRKIAHIILYATLGAAWYYYLRTRNLLTPAFTIVASLLLTSIYAATDEFHQTFIPGRSGERADFHLDTIAALAGVIITAIILHLIRTKKKGKEK